MKGHEIYRRRLFPALSIGIFLIVAALSMLPSMRPHYDLMFAVDANNIPYSAPESPGFVIRIRDHKARVIFAGQWSGFLGPDIPQIYVCEAASGRLREIHIPIHLPWQPRREGFPEPINVPDLDSLAINESNVAPDGYSLSGVADFNIAYDIVSLVHEPTWRDGTQSDNIYKQCLEKVQGHGGLTAHFIGWLIPSLTSGY